LIPRGRLEVPIAPGAYGFKVSAGAGVLAPDALVQVEVVSGQTAHCRVHIRPVFDPPARGWYAADLHHHADQAEAVTPPEDLARSQLAAGLNVLFVSDHDSTANHAALLKIARERHVAFIPGIELSPSWGHFNAYPLKVGARLAIDTGTAPIGAVLQEARREGATVVQVNHPFIPYGYFSSVAAGVAPGGFDGAFDLVEINSTVPGDDAKVLARLWHYWNEGRHYFLSGGSDTHNVWSEQSGLVRTFVHVAGAVTAEAFASALKAGHAYVTYGPIVYPATMFGSAIRAVPGQSAVLAFELGSVAGLRKVELIGDGQARETRTFENAPLTTHVDFTVQPQQRRWYALVVEDQLGRRAYTDPIWVAAGDAAAARP
ncbi:MAG TPA: CehA/McbA family metallohydrolase, partial [Steroidobacteraceae bacterium]|nr:CehA/McbA family metallohydrolase [Steroidobacteraceae bacterium]